MKRSLSSALLLCLLLIASACEDTTSPPTSNTGDKDRISDSTFAVFSLDRDSLYFQESSSIRGRGFGVSPDSLRLFVGSLGFDVVSVNDTLLEFKVPENALSGKVRLYRGDRLAEGNVRIIIVPRSPDSVTSITAFGPRDGYENEQVTILGNNLLYRQSDAKLRFGDMNTPIDSISKYAIFARVPVGVKNGSIDLIAGGRLYHLGDFRRLERPGPSTFDGNFSNVSFGIHMLVVLRLTRNFDSVNTNSTTLMNLDYAFQNPDPISFQRIGDSLIYTGQSIEGTDTTNVSMRLKLSADEPSISGTLHYSTGQRPNAQQYMRTDIVLELDSLLYRDKGYVVEMTASQVRSRDQLRLLRYEQSETSDATVTRFKLESQFDLTSVTAGNYPYLGISLGKR
jgi:hypothetical protein